MPAQIAVDREKIAALCRRHGIRKLSLFGSVLRDDFRPDSDVDLLVVWKPDARQNTFHLARVEDEFSLLFDGRKIDLVSEPFVYRRLRDRILSSAEVVYDEGDLVYVGHMLDAAREVRGIVLVKNRADFAADRVLRLAVTPLVQNIGEAAGRVSPAFKGAHSHIPWRDIVGMRNRIVHGYVEIDDVAVWDTALRDIPQLVEMLDPLVPPA